MTKDQYIDTNNAKGISEITFALESAGSMQQLAHMQVVSSKIYNEDANRTPVAYGLLDSKMGTSQKDRKCDSCGKGWNDCHGHFGYFDLEAPVFHVGYFRSIISILQCICKKCAHILLPEVEKEKFLKRLTNPNLSYLVKKTDRKRIIEKCKKIRICTNCNEINGDVKKLSASKAKPGGDPGAILNIVHEKFRNQKEDVIERHLADFKSAKESNPSLESEINQGALSEILTPIDVLKLFSLIPLQHIPLLCMTLGRAHPEDLILTRMLVPPACIRPSVASEMKNGTTEDDLTMLQVRILIENENIFMSRTSGSSFNLYKERFNSLQLYSALFINSETAGLSQLTKQKTSRGIVQRLKGKQGRFRGNLSGKRVNFSARTVISPDPHLEIDQVGVPVHIAKLLTFPEPVNKINISKMQELVMNGPEKWPGANYVLKHKNDYKTSLKFIDRKLAAGNLRVGDVVERHLNNDDIVLFNRQPSLHRLSILSHRVKVHNFRTFRFNECVCGPYNADFDGDEMNLHLPQTFEAKAEASELMGVINNLVTPKSGELVIGATQDFLTAAYLLTKKNSFYEFHEITRLLSTLFANDNLTMNISLPPPAIRKPKCLWTGKQVISALIRPNKDCTMTANIETAGKGYKGNKELGVEDAWIIVRNSEVLAGTLDKSHLGAGGKTGNVFYVLLNDHKASYAGKCMARLAKLSPTFMVDSGFSIGIGDVKPEKRLLKRRNEVLEEGINKCIETVRNMQNDKINHQVGVSKNESLESKILEILSNVRDNAGKVCAQELHSSNSPLIMANSGSKGSFINIAQMIACVGQQALNGKRVPDGFDERSLPHFKVKSQSHEARGFVTNSFYSGLTPTEFFFHTMGGREGLVDTAVKTAETGYMQRRLIKALEDLVVNYDRTVRNADNHIVQFSYGIDGLDPMLMEGDGPVEFGRALQCARAEKPSRDEDVLDANQIREASKKMLADFLPECDKNFKLKLSDFMETVARKVELCAAKYGNFKVSKEIERLTCTQISAFFKKCEKKWMRAQVEPGTAIGALAAQSIGEPGTQMTLKTFHFAGVASMNITLGVPRIKEIINASKTISTPIVKAFLADPYDKRNALKVKARIECTKIRNVCSLIASGKNIFISLKLKPTQQADFEIDIRVIRERIVNSKLKLSDNEVQIFGEQFILVHVNGNSTYISELVSKLNDLVIKGIPSVNRVVVGTDIEQKTENSKNSYYLYIEGNNFRQIMGTYGIDWKKCYSNNIIEVYATLGIEAAREVIMKEIKGVMEAHSMTVDHRHIMLLASLMTQTGQVLGITRDGLAKMKQSVFNLASFEKTADHLFDAAYYGQVDKINGISENIIMGMQAPMGTGRFKLIYNNLPQDEKPLQKDLLFESCLMSEM